MAHRRRDTRHAVNTVIMAAGSAERWGNYLGVPKQLVDIDGEPLLHRTIRQVYEWSGEAPIVTVPELGFYGPLEAPQVVGSAAVEINKFLNAFYTPETLYLWGDVYFTDEAMRAIFTTTETPCFFGRYTGSACKSWSELFAARLDADAILKAKALKRIRGLIPRCASWELYRLVAGYPLHEHTVGRMFVDIDDRTEDFDFPHDYDRWMEQA